MLYKGLHRKLKIEQHEPHKKSDYMCSERVSSSCSTSNVPPRSIMRNLDPAENIVDPSLSPFFASIHLQHMAAASGSSTSVMLC